MAIKTFLNHPAVLWARILQLGIAVSTYIFAALMHAPQKIMHDHNDVTLHFIGNVLLAFSMWVTFYSRASYKMLITMLLPTALLVEGAQYFVPSRELDPKDALVNIAGVLTGLIICKCIDNLIDYLDSRKTLHRFNS